MNELTACSQCGEKFDINYKGVNIDDQYLCANCSIEYTYTCAICEEQELEARKGVIGALLIVSDDEDDDEVGIPDGVYEIINHPYYNCPIVGIGQIFPSSVKWLGDLKDLENKFETYCYPCAYLCRYCDKKVKSTLGKKERKC